VSDVLQSIRDELARWERAGLRRRLSLPSGIDFASNDYLGLSRHPRVVEAAEAALHESGAGAPSARLLRGHLPWHERAERAAAEWLGDEAALLLPSGWHANLAVVTSLAERGDVIVSDERNHASLIDACRLSGARVEIHAHGDAAHASRLLSGARGARRRIILCEAVESTGGALAPLRALADLAREHDAWLVVDEAHAAGLFGPDGAGLSAAEGATDRVLARVVTGGKALGVAGGFIVGAREVIDLVLHKGRSFVFTTAVPPPVAAALAAAIAVVRDEPELRERALANAARLRTALLSRGIATGGASPIVPVVLGDPDTALLAAARVREHGFDVRALRPPTVPPGTSRLRIVCRAEHTDGQIDALAACVADAVSSPRPPPRPGPSKPAFTLAVVGTDTGVGKTVVSALLCRAFALAGRDVHYVKPLQTGGDSDTAAVRELAGLDAARAADPIVSLPLPASVDQASAEAGVRIDIEDVSTALGERMAASPEALWIVETAGGLLVPVNGDADQSDLLVRTVRDVVLVARSGLGTLNHTLLTVEALTRRRLRLRAVILVGDRHVANEATLATRLSVPLFSLPRLEPVCPETLDGWLDENDIVRALV